MTWRLGLDLGTNSIGWAALSLGPDGRAVTGLIELGVTIFPDGREPQQQGRVGDSLAVTRRLARSMRRNRDRGKNRKAKLMAALVAAGLMPAETAAHKRLEALDPYELRARAVDEPLTPEELGRALFHLGLRRGFKSNRKTDSGEESGKRAEQIARLRDLLDGRTLGQHLWAKLQAGEPIRFREGVDFFPERAMYEAEFDATLVIAGERIRLQGIDAPETRQICLAADGRPWACGLAAKRALAAHIAGRKVTCRGRRRDRYRRLVATCFLSGRTLGAWMVIQGWALADPRHGGAYLGPQRAARADRRGLWAGRFAAPWDWRRGKGPCNSGVGL